MNEPSRRDRRGRDTNKRHMKTGSRNTYFDGFVKKKPRPEKVGGRVYGLDADEAEDNTDDLLEFEDEPE